ncbi:MAG: hypothetical protein EOO58_04810, partial [Hymenobacter sp.]
MASTAPAAATPERPPTRPVWQSAAYTIFPDSVVQGQYHARALSATELTSNYRSPANAFQSPHIAFKFSINGKDNELAPGQKEVILAGGQLVVFAINAELKG